MSETRSARQSKPPKGSCSQRGYDFMMSEILTGRLQAGDEINRRQMAEELGISIAPIHEAVTQLESEGFLEISPRKATRVRSIKKDDVLGLMILREAIECQAARMYCGEPVRRERQRLAALAQAVDASKIGAEANELAEIQFHTALIELTGISSLKKEFSGIMRRNLFFRMNMLNPHQSPLDSHLDLLQQLEVEDPDAAERAMRNHLERKYKPIQHPGL